MKSFSRRNKQSCIPLRHSMTWNTGRLTDNCRRAFTRIFRMYDRDNDGLLSNAELGCLSKSNVSCTIGRTGLGGMEKGCHPGIILQMKLSFGMESLQSSGFLAIFDVFISQNRLDVPWRVLRKFGYDDELCLHVPPSISAQTDDKHWKLSSFGSQSSWRPCFTSLIPTMTVVLSADDVAAIFSIIPEPSLPPWHPVRAREVFEGCFSLPKVPPPSLEVVRQGKGPIRNQWHCRNPCRQVELQSAVPRPFRLSTCRLP